MKKVLKTYLFVALACFALALTFSAPVNAAKKVTLAKPKLISVKKKSENTSATVIRVKWKKVKNAKKYEIYSSVNGKKFKKIGTSKKTYFDNKLTVNDETTYSYKIKAVSGKKKSKFSNKKQITVEKYYDLAVTSDPKVNFQKLYTRINGGKSHRFSASMKTESFYYLYTITPENGKLRFHGYTKMSNSEMTTDFLYGVDEITKDSVVVENTYKNLLNGSEAKGHATIKPSTYKKGTVLTHTMDYNTTKTTVDDVLSDHTSEVIRISDTLFKDIVETIRLKNIGFTSYQ
jgi:hypothetical protein